MVSSSLLMVKINKILEETRQKLQRMHEKYAKLRSSVDIIVIITTCDLRSLVCNAISSGSA